MPVAPPPKTACLLVAALLATALLAVPAAAGHRRLLMRGSTDTVMREEGGNSDFVTVPDEVGAYIGGAADGRSDGGLPARWFDTVGDPFQGKVIWMPAADPQARRRPVPDAAAAACAEAVGDPLCGECTSGPQPACTSCVSSGGGRSNSSVAFTLNSGVCSLKLTWEEFTEVDQTRDGPNPFLPLGTYGGLAFETDDPPTTELFVHDPVGQQQRFEAPPGAPAATAPVAPAATAPVAPAATSGHRVLVLQSHSSDTPTTLRIAPAPDASSSSSSGAEDDADATAGGRISSGSDAVSGAGRTFRPVSVNVYHWEANATLTFTGRRGGVTVGTHTVEVAASTTTAVAFPAEAFADLEELVLTAVPVSEGNSEFALLFLMMDDLVFVPNPAPASRVAT